MAAFGSTLKDEIINRYLRNTTVLAPTATVYIGLFRDDPTVSGAEVGAGVGYARQSIVWAAASGGVTTGPTSIVTFGPATADWGDIVYYGIYTAVSAGTLLFKIAVSPVATINNGSSFSIAASQLTLTLD